ncbi:MAG TPA: hypothetical protein VIL01_05585 [Thermomicrobiales bacterium]
MSDARETHSADYQPDAIDIISRHVRPPSAFESSLRPGCLLSLIITALLIIVMRRFMSLPFLAYPVLFIFIYVAVITLLVRWRPDASAFDDD